MSQCIKFALEEDIGTGDVTTDSIVPANASLRGRIIAKQDGIVAGLDIAKQVFLELNNQITFAPKAEDGSRVTRGTVMRRVPPCADGDSRFFARIPTSTAIR